MTKKPEYRDLLENEEQEPWWKRQERESRERLKQVDEERKEEKRQKQMWKEEQERLKEEQDKRPQSIKNFEFMFLGLLFFELQAYVRFPEARPEVHISIPFQLGILIFVCGIFALVCLLASRKRSNIAKWVVVIESGLIVLTLTFFLPEIISEIISLNLGGLELSQVIQLVCACGTIISAFSKESRAWFAGIQIDEDESNESFPKPNRHEERTW